MKKFLLPLFVLFPSLAYASGLMIMDPWVPLAPPNAKAHAAYVTLHNHGQDPKVLVSASSANYKMSHIHISEEKNGIATMSMVEQVEIPADGLLSLEPGSFHIMLMGPKSPVSVGDEIPITLDFADGSSVEMMAVVKKRKSSGHDHKHHTH